MVGCDPLAPTLGYAFVMDDHSAPDVADRETVNIRVFRIAFDHVSGPRFRLIATLAAAPRLASRI